MKLFNSLTAKKEEFVSLTDKSVSMYTCGPTVYDSAHIGNLRSYIFGDLLKRTLFANGYSVKHVMNITDVDDKTIRRGEGDWQKFKEITKKYEEYFWQDIDALNVKRPDVITRATAYIDKIISFIEVLLDKEFAYKASDGSVYFSISKFKGYGKLSHLDKEGLKVGARVAQDEYSKENPADFALWKAWDESDGEISWDSPFGKGRPGWHIECSVMATSELGDTIDIHTGGVDLIFPHHENEIAQTEAKTGKKFVNFWLHNEHLLVDNKKMSKSLGNFYKLKDITEKGFSPLDFKYLVLQSHYRSKMNFSWEGLEAAKNTRERLSRIAAEIQSNNGSVIEPIYNNFLEKASNDLDLPEALAVLWEMVRNNELKADDKYQTLLKMDELLGLELLMETEVEVPQDIKDFAEERKTARLNKDFAKSDELRDKISELGWIIEDQADNQYRLTKK